MNLSIKSYGNTINSQTGFGNNEIKKVSDTLSSNPEPKKSGLSTTAKYMIGATALASTVAFGIIGHKSNWWRKAAQQTDNLGENNREVLSELKQLTLDKFKEVGAFVKGKAKLTNGEMYSGTITKQNKDGTTLTLEYKDGVLQKSSISGEKGVFKEYQYDDSGRLTKVLRKKKANSGRELFKNGEITFSYHSDTGNIKEIKLPVYGNTRTIYCDKNSRVKYIDRYEIAQFNAGPTDRATVEFDTITGKPKRAYMWDSRIINTYDKNGNPASRFGVAPGFSTKDVLEYGSIDPAANKRLKTILYDDSNHYLNLEKFWNSAINDISPTIQITNKRTGTKFNFDRNFNRNWIVDGELQNGCKIELTQKGDFADIIISDLDPKMKSICAKYNIKTKELEILPEFKDSASKIKDILDEISSGAQDAKRIIRGYNKYLRQKNDFVNELREQNLL